MTTAFAVLMLLAVTATVAWPLFRAGPDDGETEAATEGGDELWRREKAVAVLAITEADFDRATGKLSDDDYRVLRADYEGRALSAMDELERRSTATTGAAGARFCGGCGRGFAADDAFCGGCGGAR